ncbi:two-component system response regulator [Alsobacter soli]|uniref:Two-component system response regulator n=1 Tax=Alsobacter soli TaxID=2109933 RepID=A0A2T1HQQ8_9HYPH|nr:response regulator [Alsobacter soli]PSC03976.1 two-component system response regulator [Alsobacter soli]
MSFDRSKPVLVVDDTYAIVRIVRTLLNAQGVLDVEGAGSGPEAIRKLSQKEYGLVVCDYYMTPMSGADLKLIMDGRPEWAGIPFLLMTTNDAGAKAKLDRPGAPILIQKPFTAEALLAAMDRAVSAVAA